MGATLRTVDLLTVHFVGSVPFDILFFIESKFYDGLLQWADIHLVRDEDTMVDLLLMVELNDYIRNTTMVCKIAT